MSANTKYPGASSNSTPRTISLDISSIAPGTEITLYFDLLGFGERDSFVLIDNVRLLDSSAPTALADTATTDQAQPVTIDVLVNDLA